MVSKIGHKSGNAGGNEMAHTVHAEHVGNVGALSGRELPVIVSLALMVDELRRSGLVHGEVVGWKLKHDGLIVKSNFGTS